MTGMIPAAVLAASAAFTPVNATGADINLCSKEPFIRAVKSFVSTARDVNAINRDAEAETYSDDMTLQLALLQDDRVADGLEDLAKINSFIQYPETLSDEPEDAFNDPEAKAFCTWYTSEPIIAIFQPQ